MICPLGVMGDETISVAIKIAPNINPPDKIWYTGLMYNSGFTIQNIPENKAALAIIETGICQVITLVNSM